jgi:hypothetical protein
MLNRDGAAHLLDEMVTATRESFGRDTMKHLRILASHRGLALLRPTFWVQGNQDKFPRDGTVALYCGIPVFLWPNGDSTGELFRVQVMQPGVPLNFGLPVAKITPNTPGNTGKES